MSGMRGGEGRGLPGAGRESGAVAVRESAVDQAEDDAPSAAEGVQPLVSVDAHAAAEVARGGASEGSQGGRRALMSKTEIWESLQTIRNTVIQAHVQINHALDQIEKLAQAIQQDLSAEEKA